MEGGDPLRDPSKTSIKGGEIEPYWSSQETCRVVRRKWTYVKGGRVQRKMSGGNAGKLQKSEEWGFSITRILGSRYEHGKGGYSGGKPEGRGLGGEPRKK